MIDRHALLQAITKAVQERLASGGDIAGINTAAITAGLKFMAEQVDCLETRTDRLAQRLSAAEKQVAALTRKSQGQAEQ